MLCSVDPHFRFGCEKLVLVGDPKVYPPPTDYTSAVTISLSFPLSLLGTLSFTLSGSPRSLPPLCCPPPPSSLLTMPPLPFSPLFFVSSPLPPPSLSPLSPPSYSLLLLFPYLPSLSSSSSLFLSLSSPYPPPLTHPQFISLQQLAPTVQGSESAHENGLEQTLFERLAFMVRTDSSTCMLIYIFFSTNDLHLLLAFTFSPFSLPLLFSFLSSLLLLTSLLSLPHSLLSLFFSSPYIVIVQVYVVCIPL